MLYWPELSIPSELSAHSGHLLVLWCRDVCVCVFSVFYIKTHTPGVQAYRCFTALVFSLHAHLHVLCKRAAVVLVGDKHAAL